MKTEKLPNKEQDFKVWCDYCCIRIAPHEERTDIGEKAYHPKCHSKLEPVSGTKKKVS